MENLQNSFDEKTLLYKFASIISKDHQIKGADIIGKSMKDIHRLLNYNSRSRNDKFRRNKNSHYQRNNYGYRRNNNKVYRDKNGFIRDNRNYKRKYTP